MTPDEDVIDKFQKSKIGFSKRADIKLKIFNTVYP